MGKVPWLTAAVLSQFLLAHQSDAQQHPPNPEQIFGDVWQKPPPPMARRRAFQGMREAFPSELHADIIKFRRTPDDAMLEQQIKQAWQSQMQKFGRSYVRATCRIGVCETILILHEKAKGINRPDPTSKVREIKHSIPKLTGTEDLTIFTSTLEDNSSLAVLSYDITKIYMKHKGLMK